jgi:hypothetical protein
MHGLRKKRLAQCLRDPRRRCGGHRHRTTMSLLVGSCAWRQLSSCRAMHAPARLPDVSHLRLFAVASCVLPASLAQHSRTSLKWDPSSPCDGWRPYASAVDLPSQIVSFDAASCVLPHPSSPTQSNEPHTLLFQLCKTGCLPGCSLPPVSFRA